MQYKTELILAGMENGPPSNLLVADRLKILRTHQAAWRDLNWTSEKTISMMPMTQGSLWELYGGVLAQSRSRDVLCFTRLPSQIKGIEEEQWEVQLPVQMRDFAMDPSQNLLIAIETANQGSVVEVTLSYVTPV